MLQLTHAVLVLAIATPLASCRGNAESAGRGPRVQPIYSKETGRLEELVSDRDGDGKVDTRAFLRGTRIARVEIDRNEDGQPDRWEFYGEAGSGPSVIERAEQSDVPGGGISRREIYENGLISRVEDDTDADGRTDKWELYAAGTLARVDLDLLKRGKPNHRLVYGPGGNVTRIESDSDGDGLFVPIARPSHDQRP